MQCTTITLLGLLCLLVARGLSQAPPLPTITKDPNLDYYAADTTVTLMCNAPDAISIQWLFNDLEVAGEVGSVLTISSFSGNSAGGYSCQATYDVGTVSSATVHLELAVFDVTVFADDRLAPFDVTLTEGKPTAIDCGTVTSTPPASFIWFNGQFPIDPFAHKAITGMNGSLFFQSPTTNQNGLIVRCQIGNEITLTNNVGYIMINVEESTVDLPPPTILSRPQDVTVNAGAPVVTFECIVGGNPLPIVSWEYPDALQGSSRLGLHQNSATLQLTNVEPGDAGEFTCVVPGLQEHTATLTVREPPVLTTPLPSSLDVLYDDSDTLTCAAEGLDITWQWYHDGDLLEDATGPSLSIGNAREEDSGVYQCFATNLAGAASSAVLVQVLTVPPSFTINLPASSVAFSGQDIELVCLATGAPLPDYVWEKDSIPLSPTTDIFDIEGGVLRIAEVQDSHAGSYTCRAVSQLDGGEEVGRVETSSQLFVITTTTITNPEPSNDEAILFSVQLNVPFMLPCEASAHEDTQLEFSWTKDGSPLEITGRLAFESVGTSGTIRISQAVQSDAGVYACVVGTSFNGVEAPSVSSSQLNISVSERPVGPSIISLTTQGPNSLLVRWFFPGDSTPVVNYSIEIRETSVTEWTQVENQRVEVVTQYSIEGLQAGREYAVRVVANYADGMAVPSTEQVNRTGELPPSAPPGDVKATVLTETSLLIQWELPPESDRNGVITSYTIQYGVKDSGVYQNITVPGNSTEYTLTGLQRETSYEFRVAASTGAGVGVFSDFVVEATVITAGLQENDSSPVYNRVWFILVMFMLAIVLLVVVVILILAVRYACCGSRKTKKYHVRPISEFVATENIYLSEDAVMDYEGRSRKEPNAFGSAKVLEALEVESTITDVQYTPQLSGSSQVKLTQAPAYINPPSFEESLKHRSHTHSFSTIDKPETESEWSMGQDSRTGMILTVPGYQQDGMMGYSYEDEEGSNSMEKPPYSSTESEGSVEGDYPPRVQSPEDYPSHLQPPVDYPSHLQPPADYPSHLQPQVDYPHLQPPVDYPHLQPQVDYPHLQPQVDYPHLQPPEDYPHVQPQADYPPRVQSPEDYPHVESPVPLAMPIHSSNPNYATFV